MAIQTKESSSLCGALVQILINRFKNHIRYGKHYSLRSAILDKVEKEFEQNVIGKKFKEENLMPKKDKIEKCQNMDEKSLQRLYDGEEHNYRLHSLAVVRFIGDLFKNSIITGSIIRTCFEALLKDSNNEVALECLTVLIVEVGKIFEKTDDWRSGRKYSLESIINRIKIIASENESGTKVSSRTRNMLLHVVQLRKMNWQRLGGEVLYEEDQCVPASIGQCKNDEICKPIRCIMKKLNTENLEESGLAIWNLVNQKINEKRYMESIAQTIFEMAIQTKEYSALCGALVKILKEKNSFKNHLRYVKHSLLHDALLDKIEKEFNQIVIGKKVKEDNLKPIKGNNDEKLELQLSFDEEERNYRLHSLGVVRFIGELFKNKLITARRINLCMDALLKDPKNVVALECLCVLIMEFGEIYEKERKKRKNKLCWDSMNYCLASVVNRMEKIAENEKNKEIPARIRNMLLDVVEAHKRNGEELVIRE